MIIASSFPTLCSSSLYDFVARFLSAPTGPPFVLFSRIVGLVFFIYGLYALVSPIFFFFFFSALVISFFSFLTPGIAGRPFSIS